MANAHTSLKSLCIDIANAIREQTGGTDLIKADNFPNIIRSMSFSSLPNFIYSGAHHLVKEDESGTNWHIELLSTGTLTFSSTPPAMEIFLCAGGQVGGTGVNNTYTATTYTGGNGGDGGGTLYSALSGIQAGTEYQMDIGGSGGNTIAFKDTSIALTAVSGEGSNGGTGVSRGTATAGTDGVYAFNDASFYIKAFDATGYKFGAGGGGAGGTYVEHFQYGANESGNGAAGGASGGGKGGGANQTATAGAANSGGGGGGGKNLEAGEAGGSGIIIIRNVR